MELLIPRSWTLISNRNSCLNQMYFCSLLKATILIFIEWLRCWPGQIAWAYLGWTQSPAKSRKLGKEEEWIRSEAAARKFGVFKRRKGAKRCQIRLFPPVSIEIILSLVNLLFLSYRMFPLALNTSILLLQTAAISTQGLTINLDQFGSLARTSVRLLGLNIAFMGGTHYGLAASLYETIQVKEDLKRVQN